MKHMNAVRKFGSNVKTYGPGIAGFTLLSAAGSALADSADIADAAVAAAGQTATDVSSTAVAIVVVVALIAAAGFIFSMLRK